MLQEKNSKSLEKLLEEYWINKLSAHADQQPVLLPSRLDTPVAEIAQRVDLSAVREIAKRKPLAIFTLLLSGYALTLHRFTSEEKMLIATSGIKIEDEDLLTDLFVSVDLRPEDTFRDYITSVKSELQKVFKYRNYDKNSLLASLQEKDLRWQDLVQATFSYGVVQERPENDFFSLHVSESEDETSVILRYRKDLYHPDYAQSFVSEYTKLIEQFDRYLAKSVDDIFTTSSFLPFLHFANGEVTSKLTTMPKHNIISLFREQVSNHPEAVAVVAGAESLTFAELDQKSNQLAHYLIDEYRICKEQPVGLMSENKTWLITGLLAILKAGGCFVPIAENLPARRKAHIFEDTQLKVLLLQSDYMFDLPDYEGQVFALDIQLDTLDTSIEPPSVTLTPTQLAYIMYTSGTTGKPKGVQIEHKSVVNYANWVVKSQQITIQDRSALLSSYAFDLGYTSIWGCLMGGATLHLLNMEMNKSTGKLLEYLVEHAVTFIKTTPTLFYMLVHHTRFVSLAEKLKLRLILLGGEPIRVAGIRRYLDYAPRATFVNHYGPTEATIGAVYHRIPTDDLEEYEAHPVIGKPLKNTEAVVVNEQGHLQPFGVKGELCLAGLGLARGYWQDRGATKDKFRPHPFRGGVKMYRTGDQAILMSDGSILLSGRLDDQVKIRGYRVERKEIENVLRQLPGIQDAYVDVMQHNQDQAKILVAYLITAKEESEKQLKKALAQWLPEYMIPSQFIALSQFPTTANGKLDRQALKQRYATHQRRAENFEEAETATEKKLTTLWSEVLSLPSVSINEDFFALGGDSLRATQLLTEIHQSLGADVTLEDIFTYPSIKHLARIIDDAGKNDQKDIKQLPAAASYPVSSFQKRLWVLHSLEEDAAAYNQMKVFQLQGTINAKALTTAFRKLIMRHESLRTSFAMVNEDVRQILHQEELAKSFTVNYVDVSSANDPESAAEEIVREESHKVFDLQKAPLLRATLIALNAKTHIIQYTIHHSVSDGRSNEIILHDLQAYYKAIINGFDDSLKPLPYQFKDFLVWHQGHLSERYEEHKQYWLSHFSEEITPLELPLDKPRPSVQTFKGGVVEKSFSKQLTARLAGFAQGESATFFMLLVSLINVLLHKYSANRVITIGTPVSTRQKEPLQQVVGPFLNTLPLRNRVDPNETFRNTLRHVKTTLVQSYEHQNFPLEDILDLLPLERDLSRGALFDVLIDYNNYHEERESSESSSGRRLAFSTLSQKTTTSQADLSFNFKNCDEKLHIGLVYNPDLFLEQTAYRMLGHLEQLAETCINNPDRQIALLDYITAEERHMICQRFNDTAADYPADKTVIELFEEQVGLHADATAIISQHIHLGYGEAQTYIKSITSFLLSRSIAKGDTIGVMLDRTEDLPLAILGIMKAGGCYLPLDKKLPSERLAYLIEDSGVHYIITDQEGEVDYEGVEVFSMATLKAHTELIAIYPPQLYARDAAYMIYTSGSTGKPKGVKIAHGSLLNFLLSMQKVPGISADDVMLALTTYSFDISLLELLLPLVSGARVAIASEQTYREVAMLEQWMQQTGVSILQATPTFLNLLTESGWQGSDRLKILCGGEPMRVALGRKLLKCCADLWNMYGPTETTIWSTCKHIKTEKDLQTVGTPIANTQVYMLDAYQRMVSIGTVGEICIGGSGVALEYHNQEDLNNERFIKLPFNEGVIYRTGDLGRWSEEGEVIVLGRNDEQVKIRGHRVETGEVESALLEFEGVKLAAVVARTEPNGDKHLVGYYVSETAIAATEIYNYLSRRLPDYMIPAYYVHLNQLPLTSNGKIERGALPDYIVPKLKLKRNEFTEEERALPRNATERQLLGIWKKVLNMDSLGTNENFFRLGGNSLTAITLTNNTNRSLGLTLSVRSIFKHQTIREISTEIQRLESPKGQFEVGIIKTQKPKVAYLSHQPNLPHLFFTSPLAGILPPTSIVGIIDMVEYLKKIVSFMSLQAPPFMPELLDKIERGDEIGLDSINLRQNIDSLATEMVENILNIEDTFTYSLGGFCTGCVLTLEIVRKLTERGKKIEKLVLIDPPVWVETIADKPLKASYSKNQVADFVANDLGWDTPKLDKEHLKDMLKDCPWNMIWKVCKDYMKELNMFDRQFEEGDVKKAYERKFYHDLVLKYYFAKYPYEYPVVKAEDTLVLASQGSYHDLKKVAESNFIGHVSVEPIPAHHHELFQAKFLEQWNSKVLAHLRDN